MPEVLIFCAGFVVGAAVMAGLIVLRAFWPAEDD